MDLTFTEEQEMIKKTARDFLAAECPSTLVREMEQDERGYPAKLWRKMADMGWQGMVFPRKYNGGGGSFMNLAILFEEMGRVLLPGPFFSTIALGGLCILEAASEKQKMEFLPEIAGGNLVLTLALTEPGASYTPASITTLAKPLDKSYIINGHKLFITDAHIADYLVCATRTQDSTDETYGITLFIVDAQSPGVECNLLKTIDGSKQCEVLFYDVEVSQDDMLGELNEGWASVEKVLAMAKVAKCAEMVGGLYKVLEMSNQYAKDRVQFGHPIGINQAVQLHCADMAIDADIARFLTYKAAWSIGKGLSGTREVAAAKAWLSDAYPRVTHLGQLVHGGIGYCLEHDISLYIKRAKAAEVTFGDAKWHREVIAQELGL